MNNVKWLGDVKARDSAGFGAKAVALDVPGLGEIAIEVTPIGDTDQCRIDDCLAPLRRIYSVRLKIGSNKTIFYRILGTEHEWATGDIMPLQQRVMYALRLFLHDEYQRRCDGGDSCTQDVLTIAQVYTALNALGRGR